MAMMAAAFGEVGRFASLQVRLFRGRFSKFMKQLTSELLLQQRNSETF